MLGRNRVRSRSMSAQLTAVIEDDYIYIIKAKNRHGLLITIAIESTEDKANEAIAKFKDSVKDRRYYLDSDGNVQVGFERKLVPPSAKSQPVIQSPRE